MINTIFLGQSLWGSEFLYNSWRFLQQERVVWGWLDGPSHIYLIQNSRTLREQDRKPRGLIHWKSCKWLRHNQASWSSSPKVFICPHPPPSQQKCKANWHNKKCIFVVSVLLSTHTAIFIVSSVRNKKKVLVWSSVPLLPQYVSSFSGW